jgi:hypothetical protein
MLFQAPWLLYLQLVASLALHVEWGLHRLYEEGLRGRGVVTGNDAELKVERHPAHRLNENET